jgi:hypothetical protein
VLRENKILFKIRKCLIIWRTQQSYKVGRTSKIVACSQPEISFNTEGLEALCIMHLSMLSPREGGGSGIGGALIF